MKGFTKSTNGKSRFSRSFPYADFLISSNDNAGDPSVGSIVIVRTTLSYNDGDSLSLFGDLDCHQSCCNKFVQCYFEVFYLLDTFFLIGGNMPRPSDGTSEAARRRHRMKQDDPEKYQRLREQSKERYRKKKEEREQRWALGTRAVEQEREEFRMKQRLANRKMYRKKKCGSVRQTRTSVAAILPATPSVLGKRRCEMTSEERRVHDNEVRKRRKASRSSQKKTADRKKETLYRREYRLKKRIGQYGASAVTSQAQTATPNRMRQVCYNTSSEFKVHLKRKAFTEEEEAQVSASVVLRRIPQKRVKNILTLLENPEVQDLCKRKLFTKATSNTPKRLSTKNALSKERKSTVSAKRLLLRQAVKHFYKSERVSRQLPHSRFAARAGPGFAMVLTLREAFTLFQADHPQMPVCFSTFAELRPKEVRKLGTVPVETCLCVPCTNVGLKVAALNRLLGSSEIPKESHMLRFVLCPFKGEWPRQECIQGKCSRCSDFVRPFTVVCAQIFFRDVTWSHWERRAIDDGRVKLDVVQKSGDVSNLLEELSKDLAEPVKGRSFPQHLSTAYWQKKQFDVCRDQLKPGQVMLLQDFAENRKATFAGEVKSAHFGKQQVTLHPTVCYFRGTDGQLLRHVHMFFTDDIAHDYHAVHQFTLKSIELLKYDTTVEEVIAWSDGAASQYKGKGNFADLTLYPVKFQRNYFGSDHGKGESDGETGRFSQYIRRAVAKGHCFRDAKDMASFGTRTYPASTPLKKYYRYFIVVPPEDIIRDRPQTNVGTLPGTRSLHQVISLRPYVLKARTLSCFCTACSEGRENCVRFDFVSPFETYKMKPSVPLNDAFVTDADPQPEEEKQEEPTFSGSSIPTVGEWVQIKGQAVQKKGKQPKDLYYYAVVQPSPVPTDFFYVEFLKRTPAGTYIFQDVPDRSEICPGEPCFYEWRVVPPPKILTRLGSSRSDSLACQFIF